MIDIPALELFNNNNSLIESQYEWEEISAIYHAKGGEKNIALGNFSNINKDLLNADEKDACTYMFVDYVSVKEFEEISLEFFNANKSIKKGQRLLLSDVEFEFGKDILVEKALEELNTLANLLVENPTMKIEISSHCDNRLEAARAISCTKARVKNILDFLVERQVLIDQIVTKGKGSMEAISLNNSTKGREKNDRVELKILEL